MASEIFISYRRSDQAKARLLHALLKKRGVDAWYDAQVGAGDDWRRVTAKALDAAPIFVLLFSKSASESDDISKELAAATFSKKMVVPVRIEDITPTGEFLYELASRNWFDAFEDTEARFEILADRLAALVKGGPQPDAAAASLSAGAPAPAIKRLPPVLKRPLVRVGIAAAALVLVAVLAMFAIRPQTGPAQAMQNGHLIAFFGFTPTANDPALGTMAENATDRMFEAIRSNLFNAVARTETRNTPEDSRIARAAELGARYALGGEVRATPDGMTLVVRFEDVRSRLTLWERSFSTRAPDLPYLPAQAARQSAEVMWCIIKTRSELTHETAEILTLIADRCRDGAAATSTNVSYIVGRMREVAEADPGSAYNQAQLVMMLGLGVATAPAEMQTAWLNEAEAVLQRAIKVDPEEPGIYVARFSIAEAKGVPAAEWEALTLEAMTKAEGKDAFVFGQANIYRFIILRSAGRFREALPHAVAAVASDPLTSPWTHGWGHALVGQSAEARAILEPALDAYGPWVWPQLSFYAIFLDAADAEAVLASPPSSIPKPTVECLRDIRSALASSNPRVRARGAAKVRACGDTRMLRPMSALAALAALGDLDGAFAMAGQQAFNASTVRVGTVQALFWPTSREMRADPRFLPLVEKLGIMDYWRATKSQPDVCEAEPAPFCEALKSPTIR
jgi:TolB-like protein